MKPTATIRLLTESTNEKGDLFNRLMSNLFYALGYDDIHLDVQKTGREIDIQGRHRHEPRLLRAECKAHATKMGGRDMNAFFGGVTREREKAAKNGETVAAYFVSLGGFTESGVEQENDTSNDRIILFNSKNVIQELETARLLVNDTQAATLAGQCLQVSGEQGLAIEEIELLGHEIGFIKVLYYERNKQRTHFALIHADGNSLAEAVAHDVIEADKVSGGILHTLHYLVPPKPAPDYKTLAADAIAHYKRWLGEECGSIQLDGLPTDSDLGPRKLELERLFVPLHVLVPRTGEGEEEMPPAKQAIGKRLTSAAHLAILASPGGGKSTLLKRLATAYAFPDRRQEIGDKLPQHDWLPLFVRCRELQQRATSPILAILGDIPAKAEMSAEMGGVFMQAVQEALQTGRVLLLVDGLDEISREAARLTFANSLRSFLAVFPQVALVVTSREAGFRLVAGTIASVCEKVQLASFSRKDIQRLCVSWLTEVETNTQAVRDGALKLADDIWGNERIRALAENPLLLTTLLVVKRWIGELPRSRAALYGVATQVLVRTWNVEGHEPLDEQETLAQLSYVACAMMEQGIQQISHNALLRLLEEARQELEAELQFTQIVPAKFIERVESRSSILMQTGRVVEDGELQPVYEFRHLTFQEFLTARGYAKEQHPQRNKDIPFVELLAPHFKDERWREVIPLAAVLAERKATESIIKKLIELCENPGKSREVDYSNKVYINLLVSCILDEVKLTSSTLISAIKKIALYRHNHVIDDNTLGQLKGSKIGELMLTTIEQEYTSGVGEWFLYGSALADLYYDEQLEFLEEHRIGSFIDRVTIAIGGDDRLEGIRAAFELMMFCFRMRRQGESAYVYNQELLAVHESEVTLTPTQVLALHEGLNKMLASQDLQAILVASWALAWAGVGLFYGHEPNKVSIELLLNFWYDSENQDLEERKEVGEFVVWAFASSGLLDRNAIASEEVWQKDWSSILEHTISMPKATGRNYSAGRAAATLAWYRRAPWSGSNLARLIANAYGFGNQARIVDSLRDQERAFELLDSCGEAGQRAMQEQVTFIENLRQEHAASSPESLPTDDLFDSEDDDDE
jgi:hypothetical protein